MSRRVQRLLFALVMMSLFGVAACERREETEEGTAADTLMQADTAFGADTAPEGM